MNGYQPACGEGGGRRSGGVFLATAGAFGKRMKNIFIDLTI